MARLIIFVYGTVCYVIFFLSFCYALAFVGNIEIGSLIPKTIDSGETGSMSTAIAINLLLLSAFAIQHSIMARPFFKERWTKIIPEPAERSTYVVLSSIVLIVLFCQWRPMPEPVWNFEEGIGFYTLTGLFFGGWLLVLYATFLIDHFELFGLKQVIYHLRGKDLIQKKFMKPSLYKYIRHPLYLGWFIAFWATPTMSQGHLLFAIVTTVYILVAVQFEERDLVKTLGDEYVRYRETTPTYLPIPKSGKTAGKTE